MKEQHHVMGRRTVSHIQFGTMSSQQMQRLSEVNVYAPEMYAASNRKAVDFGPLDRRMGAFDKATPCSTCALDMRECVGHFGHIELELPVFHIGYFKATVNVLQRICKTCSRVLMTDDLLFTYTDRLLAPHLESNQRQAIIKEAGDLCKKTLRCPHCGAQNATVKKVPPMKIVHELYVKKHEAERTRLHDELAAAAEEVDGLRSLLRQDRAQDVLNPLRVLELFRNIPDSDCLILDLGARPESLLLTSIICPPGCIRPSVMRDASATSSSEDPISVSLTGLDRHRTRYASCLRLTCLCGQKLEKVMETWEQLQISSAILYNGQLTNLMQTQKKPIRGFFQRLKGKQGRFRGNLSGKRVNFSGRTVISPDPNVGVDEVCVPYHVCRILTYPEQVTKHNLEKLRKMVLNGPKVYPGATTVELRNGDKKSLAFANRRNLARNLSIGDKVLRHLLEGDYVLFNRQPSLHRMSIMCHKAKPRPWRTFRFNECVCKPYNADFDGDEMNLHVPQTEEARAEAAELMLTTNNLCTPCNGKPLIAATQDFITGAYLLTTKDVFLSRQDIAQLACYMGDGELLVHLPPPTIIKPMKLWTGKQVISLLLKPNKFDPTEIYLQANNRSYDKDYAKQEFGGKPTLGEKTLCPEDGFVLIRKSQLLSGFLDKGIIGESKSSIFYALLSSRLHPPLSSFISRVGILRCCVCGLQCMKRLSKLTTRFLMNRGFSIGIGEDGDGGGGAVRCKGYIQQLEKGNVECQPGCTAEQTVEAKIKQDLSAIREDAGLLCRQLLPNSNAPKIMAKCGSKGSNIPSLRLHLRQMIACVGQQIINGERIPDGFDGRPLPHFKEEKSREPVARGFVENSFYTGLTPTEFFFHTMSGREGLVDTAVKTAETGYMQRRLVKALEDLSARYDTTVRNSSNGIIQFCYGEDGMDPQFQETDNCPVDLERLFSVTCTQSKHATTISSASSASHARSPSTPPQSRPSWLSCVWCVRAYLFCVCVSLLPEDATRVSAQESGQHRRCSAATGSGALHRRTRDNEGPQCTAGQSHIHVCMCDVCVCVCVCQEIINAAKKISTPVIEAPLEEADNAAYARRVKGRIETITLEEVAEYVRIFCSDNESYVAVKLDLQRIANLFLEIDVQGVVFRIVSDRKLKVKPNDVDIKSASLFHVYPRPDTRKPSNPVHLLQALQQKLGTVVVQGLENVNRAIVNDEGGVHKLFIDGTNMRGVMSTLGVLGEKVKCNHVMEVEKTLGIEAARQVIMDQVQYVMSNYGISIDPRHTMLMGDLMTFKGEVLGITRFGIAKMKDSVFMLASFEKTIDHLFDAAMRGTTDPIEGVSECIIVGKPMKVGTGAFSLLQSPPPNQQPPKRRKLLFDVDEYHPHVRSPML
ncbi:RNA polymerase III large subunit [Salpingoeca rosetta]|uniref:DNA-directed RNA polymerase subunit n=1 Tax=Salpingoeca rosetta (strain ATCC 50818 / BSB-021) TaxID=946362 RepID=F2USG9_SALR5|nr:RNA polymerase III large subunit [Salpingoeca rosetta]EGD81078.1 RNA polymerase III large subunit [Salpingoeca rosetta]|eukprot:XP_004987947.1 RNA polymerase III large subunit [Salpingoeca rosetta]